ncbi:hypothetical protein AMK59_294, partial [Oryctes borbonicus]
KTEENLNISIKVQHRDNLLISPEFIEIDSNTTETKVLIELQALKAGETNLYTNSSAFGSKQAFITVQIYKNQAIEILSIIIGWAYFFTWSISFYPQAYENYKRRSVVGLNFDFVVVNITGYVLYSMFNLGLYYIPAIRVQYEERYPFSIVSVLLNDIVFGIHAFAITAYTGLQCIWYDRGDQTISWFGKWFHYISAGIMAVTAVMCFVGYMLWLDFLYICSYIKLSVTFCKYGPQAIMNYRRQSTEGWSITTVLLDIAGGICSVLQMFMNAYNYEKWAWILENPTKLWLGVFSLLFDFFFVFQHYCLYNKKHKNRRQANSDAKTEMALSEKECLKISEDDKLKPENGNIIKD